MSYLEPAISAFWLGSPLGTGRSCAALDCSTSNPFFRTYRSISRIGLLCALLPMRGQAMIEHLVRCCPATEEVLQAVDRVRGSEWGS